MLVRLKSLRKEQGLSQQKLANELGISQQSINKYENHDVEPDIAMLRQMADYFQTTVDYLVGHTDDPAKPLSSSTSVLTREEAGLISNYRQLSSDEKNSILLVVHNYIKSKKEC